MSKENTLARIVDENDLMEFVKMDEFLQVVNLEPPKSFIKDHPLAKGVKFVPIDKTELMLTKLFQQWRVEILREGQLLNSVYVAVRLHYFHPINKAWTFQDGVGAVQIQVDKGENASNLSAIKSDAIMKALPAAESFAVKDAADKIGKIFGRDLNRRDALGFSPSYGTDEVKKEQEAKKQAQREKLYAGITPKQENRPTSMDGDAPLENNGQEQQDDQAAE